MKGMSPTKSGVLFLIMVLSSIGASLLLSLLAVRRGSFDIPVNIGIILSQGLIVIPALIFAICAKASARESFRFRPVKFSTILLTILYVMCLEPLIMTLNAFTMLFTDNAAVEIANGFTEADFSLSYMIFIIAIVGPFCEEFVFRGIIYSGLRQSGRILAAIVIQGIMFGFMHLNVNQMAYAVVIGIAFGLLSEVTGSIWPGFAGHFFINGSSTILTWVVSKNGELLSSADDLTKEMLLTAMLSYAVVSVFFTGMAIVLLNVIAGNEPGGKMRLLRIIHPVKHHEVGCDGLVHEVKRPHAITIPAVLGLLLCAVMMCLNLIKVTPTGGEDKLVCAAMMCLNLIKK